MTPSASPFEALAYEAPFLIEKLLKEHIVDTAQEAQALFTEVKRYIVLVRCDDTMLWDMYSLRIDEAWHQFVLFTAEYIEFCLRYFGTYIDHSPSNAPQRPFDGPARAVGSFEQFQQRYAALFGAELPATWFDETHVRVGRRVLNDHVGCWQLHQDAGMSHLCDDAGERLLSVNDLAHPALAFIVRTPAFYVRELPGGLEDEEKVALIAALVQHRLLRVGA